MEPYVYWFGIAFILLGLELVTGTFYLLVLAVGLAVGGLAALAGLPAATQYVAAAVVGALGVVFLHRWKASRPAPSTATQDLEVGQAVQVVAWREDGTARVRYRGAEWDGELESPDTPREGTFYIREVRGLRLVLTHQKP